MQKIILSGARLAHRVKCTLRALRSATSGVAMVEFALTLPVFATISFVGVETARFVAVNMRLSQIALMVADNAGRVRSSIDETDIEEVMVGARTAGDSIKFGENGRVILSSLAPNGLTGTNAGQKIVWQRCFGKKSVTSSYGTQNAGASDASMAGGMGPTGNKIAAMSGAVVMFVELKYEYKPVTPGPFFATRTLTYTAAYTVRERASETMTNISNLAAAKMRTCDLYSAT